MAGEDRTDGAAGAAGDGRQPRGGDDETYCRLCGDPLTRGAVSSEQRACCLNATPIAGVCPTHGPVGPHHAVDSLRESDGTDESDVDTDGDGENKGGSDDDGDEVGDQRS